MTDFSFVVAINDRIVLERNLLASPALREVTRYEIITRENSPSAAKAYNGAIDESHGEILVFLHQDIYLPSGWLARVESCIGALDRCDPDWGVAGCWGVTKRGERFGHLYSTGLGVLGFDSDVPKQVQTLDEVVLIMRKSQGLRFDERLPYFHFYGTDLCMSAFARGRRSYAISAFCIHNSNFLRVLPPEFYKCYDYIKKSWRQHLPIHTSCIRISRFDKEMRLRRIQELVRYCALSRSPIASLRAHDPACLLVT